MLIDAHNHVNYAGFGAQDIVEEMEQFGIDRIWLLTWYLPPGQENPGAESGTSPLNFRPDGSHAGMTLDHILQAQERFPRRFVAGYCPCPHEGSAANLFEAAWKIHGVRVCGEWSYRMLLDDPKSIKLFRRAGELGSPVVLHMDVPSLPGKDGPVSQDQWYGGDIRTLEKAMQACPDTVFVGHAPGFWRYISGDADTASEAYPPGPIAPGGELTGLFERFPNLWADISSGSGLNALRRDVDHGREFVVRFQDRLLFGRDQPGNDHQEFLTTLDLSDEVLEKIRYKNALKLVPLDS